MIIKPPVVMVKQKVIELYNMLINNKDSKYENYSPLNKKKAEEIMNSILNEIENIKKENIQK